MQRLQLRRDCDSRATLRAWNESRTKVARSHGTVVTTALCASFLTVIGLNNRERSQVRP